MSKEHTWRPIGLVLFSKRESGKRKSLLYSIDLKVVWFIRPPFIPPVIFLIDNAWPTYGQLCCICFRHFLAHAAFDLVLDQHRNTLVNNRLDKKIHTGIRNQSFVQFKGSRCYIWHQYSQKSTPNNNYSRKGFFTCSSTVVEVNRTSNLLKNYYLFLLDRQHS